MLSPLILLVKYSRQYVLQESTISHLYLAQHSSTLPFAVLSFLFFFLNYQVFFLVTFVTNISYNFISLLCTTSRQYPMQRGTKNQPVHHKGCVKCVKQCSSRGSIIFLIWESIFLVHLIPVIHVSIIASFSLLYILLELQNGKGS